MFLVVSNWNFDSFPLIYSMVELLRCCSVLDFLCKAIGTVQAFCWFCWRDRSRSPSWQIPTSVAENLQVFIFSTRYFLCSFPSSSLICQLISQFYQFGRLSTPLTFSKPYRCRSRRCWHSSQFRSWFLRGWHWSCRSSWRHLIIWHYFCQVRSFCLRIWCRCSLFLRGGPVRHHRFWCWVCSFMNIFCCFMLKFHLFSLWFPAWRQHPPHTSE